VLTFCSPHCSPHLFNPSKRSGSIMQEMKNCGAVSQYVSSALMLVVHLIVIWKKKGASDLLLDHSSIDQSTIIKYSHLSTTTFTKSRRQTLIDLLLAVSRKVHRCLQMLQSSAYLQVGSGRCFRRFNCAKSTNARLAAPVRSAPLARRAPAHRTAARSTARMAVIEAGIKTNV
jgi:hypothetical protein